MACAIAGLYQRQGHQAACPVRSLLRVSGLPGTRDALVSSALFCQLELRQLRIRALSRGPVELVCMVEQERLNKHHCLLAEIAS